MTSTLTAEPELATILRSYHEVTERLKRSHERLHDEVCRLREELVAKNRELERQERLAALGQMAAGLAHEIRNPLGGIGLYASLLERDLAEQAGPLAIARRISLGVRSMESVIGDILAFAGDVSPRLRRCRFSEILDAALTQVAPRAELLEIDIEVDLRLAQMELRCDAGQIERALVNLLVNAIEAVGRHGRVWVRAGESARPNGARLRASEARRQGRKGPSSGMGIVVVEDNGPGVPAELADRIFNPFFTTKDTGTGLGLAIVHAIVEAHGGRIALAPRPDRGAAFVLFLPLAEGETGADLLAGGARDVGTEDERVISNVRAGG